MNDTSATSGPLADLTVVELGDGTSAPYAAKLLADFGANVIKVEPLQGDSSRRRGPFPDGKFDPEASGLFLYLNTNKRGVVIDITTPEGRGQLNALLKSASIFITNLPQTELSAAGFDSATLRSRYPELIVTTISPFGLNGPWANYAGSDIVTFAASGMAYATPGIPDASIDLYREPPLHPDCFVAETVSGIVASVATMSAILAKRIGGRGCHIEVSEQAALASMQIRDVMSASYTGNPYNRLLNPQTIGRMPNFYLPCKDGYVTIAAPLDIHWERLVEMMGSPEWALGEKFSSTEARIENWIELRLKLIDWTMTINGDDFYAAAEKAQLPCFNFYSISKLVQTEQVRERRSVVPLQVGGRLAQMPGAPVQMRGSPWALRRPAPRLGEHTASVVTQSQVAIAS